jgi:hypothetical protein
MTTTTVNIFGIKLNTTVFFAVAGFVWYKFGMKYFAGLMIAYFIFNKKETTTTATTTGSGTGTTTNPSFGPGVGIGGGIGGSIIGGKSYDGVAPMGTTFTEFLKNIPYPTINGDFFPQLFSDVTPPLFDDPITGRRIPTMIFAANSSVLPFYNRGIKPFFKGVNVDLTGDGDRNCIERFEFMGGACPGVTVYDFDSATSFNNRGIAVGWGLNADGSRQGLQPSSQAYFDYGRGIGSCNQFGFKNGEGEALLVELDVENGLSNGSNQEEIDAAINLYEGFCDNVKGYVYSPYQELFNTLGYEDPNCYPDVNGNYPNAPKNGIFWGTCQDGPAAGKSAQNGTLSKKFVFGTEVSHVQDDTIFEEGEQMISPQGNVLRVASHFGDNATLPHYLARVAHIYETRCYAAEQKGYRFSGYVKSVCDRSGPTGEGWTYLDHNKVNLSNFGSRHIGRDATFKSHMTTAMVGIFIDTNWDRNSFPLFELSNLDSYHGWLEAIQQLNFIKDFGTDELSFLELRPNLKFQRWKSKISFNGKPVVTQTALEVKKSKDVITGYTAVDTVRGYMVVWGAKAYKVENVQTIGFEYEDENWYRTADTTTYSLTTEKDYVFDIVKLNPKIRA